MSTTTAPLSSIISSTSTTNLIGGSNITTTTTTITSNNNNGGINTISNSTATAQSLSRTAEKLIILLDYSIGLLTRVHGCVNFNRGPVFEELNDKVIEHLSQKKEDPTLNVSKQIGAETISMKAEALENETRFVYETFVDILAFAHEVLPLFDTLTRSILTFDLHKNSDLTTRFLGVFFNFIRIYLLSSRVTNARIACYLYTLAYKEHHRKEHDDAHLVKQYLMANATPLKQLQKELGNIHGAVDVVCGAIQCVMQSFYTWTNYESLKVGQYFSVSQQNPETFAQPVEDDKIDLYQDASHLDSIGTWIIYLYLVFPEKLNDETARLQLEGAFNDRTVVVLFRDELIDALAEYKNLQNTSLATIKVPTNIIKKAAKVNLETLTSRHRQMRELLRREIRGLLDLVHALPGVIPVKLPVLMACLALARYEIFWLFTHMSLKNSKQNKLKDAQLAAPTMPDLMYQCLRLATTILEHQELICTYYTEQLLLDLKGLKPFLTEMRKKDQIPLTVFEQVDGIVQTVDSLVSSKQILSLEGLRLRWYRASADMSREPSIINKPAGIALVKLMNPLIEHTRFYDRLDKEVDARGSMAMLWFYRSHLASVYNIYCMGADEEEELKKSNEDDFASHRQGRYWIVFLHVFSHALQNVHRQRPEEVEIIGESALAKAESYLAAATSKIEVSLRNVLGQFSVWSSQTQPLTVADHFLQNRGKRQQWEQLPGFESYWPNRVFLKNLKFNLDVIGDMCAAFDEVDQIIIYNQKLYPAGYLYQLLRDFFHSELRLLVQETQQTMVRPSRFLDRLQRLFRACSRLHSYINLDLERMIRDLLYADFYDDSAGGVGGPLGVPKKQESTSGAKEKTKTNERLIHDIRDWYVNIVDSRCALPGSGAVYSPILSGFYDLQSNRTAPLEDYCSLSELEALCQVIGPAGVRVIDIEMVKIGHAAMVKIAKTFRDNKDLIQGVELDKFLGEERWKNVVSRFRGLDIISKQGIVVGSVILFRKLLRKALANAVRQRDPFTSDTMRTLHDRLYHKRIYIDSFGHLSLDVGIVSTFSDNVMRNVFYELGKDDSTNKLWQYIPLVFGVAFANPFWRGCRYSMEFGALDNNGFAIADCVQNLISIYCDPQEHRKMKLQFLGIAGRSLLYMKKSRNDPIVNHLYLLLDYFVSLSKDLTLHDLQSVSIPYDVIRAQIVKIYGDASGMKTDDPLTSQDDDVKQEETV